MANQNKKPDLQTLSLFITLAVLTGMFVLGLKWVFLTPERGNNQNVEATK